MRNIYSVTAECYGVPPRPNRKTTLTAEVAAPDEDTANEQAVKMLAAKVASKGGGVQFSAKATLKELDPTVTVSVSENALRKVLAEAERTEEYAGRMEPTCIYCGFVEREERGRRTYEHKPECPVIALKRQLSMEIVYGP